MSPLCLSSSYLTLEPKGISITTENSSGRPSPGEMSCQAWVIRVECSGGHIVTNGRSELRRHWGAHKGILRGRPFQPAYGGGCQLRTGAVALGRPLPVVVRALGFGLHGAGERTHRGGGDDDADDGNGDEVHKAPQNDRRISAWRYSHTVRLGAARVGFFLTRNRRPRR